MRLLVALHAVKYYELTSCTMEPENMSRTVLKSFDEQSKALLERKDAKGPEIPKLTKGLSVLYVKKNEAAVPAVPPVLLRV